MGKMWLEYPIKKFEPRLYTYLEFSNITDGQNGVISRFEISEKTAAIWRNCSSLLKGGYITWGAIGQMRLD
jgi:hypothetical protein